MSWRMLTNFIRPISANICQRALESLGRKVVGDPGVGHAITHVVVYPREVVIVNGGEGSLKQNAPTKWQRVLGGEGFR